MKPLILLPLVLFIAIAGYQFGYYQAKLTNTDTQSTRPAAQSDRVSLSRSERPASELAAQQSSPSLLPGVSTVHAATRAAPLMTEAHDDSETPLPQAETLRQALEGHPLATELTVISVACEDVCEVTGDYKGDTPIVKAIVADVSLEYGWKNQFSREDMQRVGDKTHFIVHFDTRSKKS